jgi:hypothetical protein
VQAAIAAVHPRAAHCREVSKAMRGRSRFGGLTRIGIFQRRCVCLKAHVAKSDGGHSGWMDYAASRHPRDLTDEQWEILEPFLPVQGAP